MDRKSFLKSLLLLPLSSTAMNLEKLEKITSGFKSSDTLPVLFFGHGSPMNAIEDNQFSRGWRESVKNLELPSAIICVSAHWETNGTYVTAMQKPRTIHDFGGFPAELFEVQYPAPGSPELAEETRKTIKKTSVGLDQVWGLDHGCWSVVKHLYPQANIPVIQLSLDRSKPPAYHFELASELKSLRNKGVLIVGSGNMVHNLGMLDWRKNDQGFEWADQANHDMKRLIVSGEFQKLINYKEQGKAFQLSIPTPEHYLPLLYTLGLKNKDEKISFFNDKTTMGSISMTSIKIESA
jgi:4,5-DOPA dioxygenase extradiol